MKVKVKWACPKCSHRHSWKWDEWDMMPGAIGMVCDECGRESALHMRKTCEVSKKGRTIWRAE